jgi:hypothetical protein
MTSICKNGEFNDGLSQKQTHCARELVALLNGLTVQNGLGNGTDSNKGV